MRCTRSSLFTALCAAALAACGPAPSPSPPPGPDASLADAAVDDAVAVDITVADAAADASADDAAKADGGAPACDSPCGSHGHLHGSECHCDDGYVDRSMCCVPAPPCTAPDDDLEENDTAAGASVVRDGALERVGLRVCPADLDVYRVPLRAGQRVTASVRFTHARGDLDVYLYAPGTTDFGHRTPLAASDGTRDNERLTHTAAAGGDHMLVVLGYNGAENAYDLTVRVDGP
jgi:hypothetical protein